MARRSDVIAFELWHQNRCLGTKAGRNSSQLFVVIGVFLLVPASLLAPFTCLQMVWAVAATAT